MRRATAPALAAPLATLAAAAVLSLLSGSAAQARGLGDCDRKVPADAERVFQSVATAFRSADATGVTASMPPSRDARLYLSLSGLDSGSFAREQATALLEKDYFPTRRILSILPADGCTAGDDTRLSRTYRVRFQVGREEHDGMLIVALVKKKIDEKTSAWFLGSLKEP